MFLCIDAARTSAGPPPSLAVREKLTTSVAAIIKRDPEGLVSLRRAILGAPAGIAAPLLSATEMEPSVAFLQLCSDLLGFDPTLDLLLVSTAGKLAAELPPAEVMEFQDAFRRLLREDSTQLLGEAVLALGRMEDFEAAQDLADLLEHEDAGVRANAVWSLQHMTGLRLPQRTETWSVWLTRQGDWFRESFPDSKDALDSSNLAVVASSLSDLAGRRYERHRVATAVIEVLYHADPRARVLACQTLAQLGSSVAIPALEELLEGDEPEVMRAASSALVLLVPVSETD